MSITYKHTYSRFHPIVTSSANPCVSFFSDFELLDAKVLHILVEHKLKTPSSYGLSDCNIARALINSNMSGGGPRFNREEIKIIHGALRTLEREGLVRKTKESRTRWHPTTLALNGGPPCAE